MRVADTNLTWTAGKVLLFDDSFEHEVWHEGEDGRYILHMVNDMDILLNPFAQLKRFLLVQNIWHPAYEGTTEML